MEVLPAMMAAPLPRVWDEVEGGLAEPARSECTRPHTNLAGGECDIRAVSSF